VDNNAVFLIYPFTMTCAFYSNCIYFMTNVKLFEWLWIQRFLTLFKMLKAVCGILQQILQYTKKYFSLKQRYIKAVEQFCFM